MNRPRPSFWTLHRHDARDLDELLGAHSSAERPLLSATITSPPYGGLKDYGHRKQIGYGQSYDEYLSEMRAVFATLCRHTRADGSMWLIADSYMQPGPAPRRLAPVPFDLAKAAEEVGWTLRDVIVWRKDRTLPWSNGTRVRNSFEYVVLLVRTEDAKYRLDRLREHSHLREWWARFPERYSPEGKAPSNVWDIPIPLQGAWGRKEMRHACPLPPDLVERLLLLTTDPGDVVIDPFAGAGVVVAEAARMGRRAVGCELVRSNVEQFEIVRQEIERRPDSTAQHGPGTKALMRGTIIDLRILKLCRVLMEQVARKRATVPWPVAALALHRGRRRNGSSAVGQARIVFIVDAAERTRSRYSRLAESASALAPASKFGVECEIETARSSEIMKLARGRRLYMYPNGRTTRTVGAVAHTALAEKIREATDDPIPPIFSDLRLEVPPRADAALFIDSVEAD